MVQNYMMKKAQTRKSLLRKIGLLKSLNYLNHVFEVHEESGIDVDYIEDSLK